MQIETTNVCCLRKECDFNSAKQLSSVVVKNLRYQTKVIKTNKPEASYTTLQWSPLVLHNNSLI